MRYAVRLLLKNRGLTTAAALSLALGIGANTLMFSIVNSVLIRPLPYPESDRLVFVWFTPPKHPDQKRTATAATFLALRKQNGPLEHIGVVGGVEDTATLTVGPGDIAEQVEYQRFTAGVPHALDAKPLLGRWFTEAEDRPAIVIGYGLWQRRFSGATGILGKTVRIDGEPTAIVGVMPEGWALFNSPAQFWTPYRLSPADRKSSNRIFPLIARLKRGKSLRQAQEEMNGIAAGLAEEFPSTNKGWGLRLEPAANIYTGWVRQPLLIVQGVVLLVLLIACANVTGLLLVEAEARRKEVAVRAALGAGRWRIARQFLIESVLLSTLGGLCGIALAYGGLKLFIAISPPWFPRLGEIALDARILGFTAVLSLATALVFGLVPALQLSRPELIESLKQAGQGVTIGRRQTLHSAFVVLETSLTLVLLIGTGLMLNTLFRLYDSPTGCDCRNLLTFQAQLPKSQFVKKAGGIGGDAVVEISPRADAIFEQIRERISGMARVRSVAAGARPALSADALDGLAFNFAIEGQSMAGRQTPSAAWFPVSAGYFHTVGVTLLRGREFGIEDTAASMPVVVINEAMARRFWSNEDPIGKRLRIDMVNEPSREIAGVVGNVRHNRRDRDVSPEMYIPYVQHAPISQGRFVEPRLTRTFVVRTFGDPLTVVPSVRAAVAEVSRNVPVFKVKTMDAYVAEQLWQPKQTAILLSIFGGIAVVLAMAGIYGLIAYAVRRRTREIGIRIALGASGKDVLRLMIAQGLLLVALGIGIGLAGAIAVTRILRAMLWGVTTTDPRTYTVVVIALLSAAVLACYLPARKALGIEPTVALRHD